MNLKNLFNKTNFHKLKETGFFSIFISSILSKILVFIGGVVLIRVLSKTDYGIYAYVLNCISMLCLLNDFGVSSAAFQYLTENFDNEKKQGAILKYSLFVGIYASIVGSILILLSPIYYPFMIDKAKSLTQILCILPFLTLINGLIPVILRAKLDNKNYGKLQILSTFFSYLTLIPLSLAFGVFGAIISQYFYNIIILIVGLVLILKYLKKYTYKENLKKSEKKEFVKFSLATQINNTIGGALIIIDTFIIGLLIANPIDIASYKVASIIPHALSFLPTCVVIYTLPYFIKNNQNIAWMKKNFNRLIKYGLMIYAIICLGLIVFSKLTFSILYGNKYNEAIPIFIVLIIGFFFSATFKIPCSNIVYSMKKVRVNIIINVISIIINFISNIIFLRLFGVIGVAITTTLINIISSIIYVIYINKLLKKKEVY